MTDIDFDKFNKESAYALIDKVNALYNEKEKLKIFLNVVNEELSLANSDNDTLEEENEHYKSIFFELVETALTDKNCRELYCKGILDIFNKANSLNQAREMIKEHLE